MPSYRVCNTEQSGVFYMFCLLKIDQKREKKVAYCRNTKNFEEKVYGCCGNLIAKVKLVAIAFIIREKSK